MEHGKLRSRSKIGSLDSDRSHTHDKRSTVQTMTCPKGFQHLQGKKIGEFYLRLLTRPKKRVGHWDVYIHLQDEKRRVSQLPAIIGLYSCGNKRHQVFPWFDIHYLDFVNFEGGRCLTLSRVKGFTEALFRMVGETIPPGGMIFLSYLTDRIWEFDSPLHEFTRRSLSVRSLRIPAAALPLGRLLFLAGCQNIKGDVYDVQGSGRLGGEKAPTSRYEKLFLKELVVQLEEYLFRLPSESFRSIDENCRSHAIEILEDAKFSLQNR